MSNFGAKTITTSATLIVSPASGRRNLSIANNGINDVFIGPDDTVITSNGLPLFGGSTRDRDFTVEGYKGAVYGIVSSRS